MEIKIKVYDGSKYEASFKKVAEVIYKNVKKADVVKISDDEIFNMGFEETDIFGEYFVVEFEDGEISTFRNSLVDAFMI